MAKEEYIKMAIDTLKKWQSLHPEGTIGFDTCKIAIEALKYTDSIHISKDVTNGDMIKTIFSNLEVVDDFTNSLGLKLNNSNYIQFNKDWWDAPYKKTNNDSNNLKDGE